MLFQLIKGGKMLSKSQLAIIYMIASVACFSIMDIIVKYLKRCTFWPSSFYAICVWYDPNLFLIPREKKFLLFIKLKDQDFMLGEQYGEQ